MKRNGIQFASIIVFATLITSCSMMNKTMREPYTRVDFTKNDFALSEQVSGTSSSTKFLDIDWFRVFHSNDAGAVIGENGNAMAFNFSKIPVIGSFITDKTVNYAIYEMMKNNPGYDVVFYPQYEARIRKPFLGLGFIYKKTTVKATARLGKMK